MWIFDKEKTPKTMLIAPWILDKLDLARHIDGNNNRHPI